MQLYSSLLPLFFYRNVLNWIKRKKKKTFVKWWLTKVIQTECNHAAHSAGTSFSITDHNLPELLKKETWHDVWRFRWTYCRWLICLFFYIKRKPKERWSTSLLKHTRLIWMYYSGVWIILGLLGSSSFTLWYMNKAVKCSVSVFQCPRLLGALHTANSSLLLH